MRLVARLSLGLMAALYVAAGCAHFATPAFFVEIVPPWVPWPAAAVAISGAAEIVLGMALLPPATRRLAAWGLIALLIAVSPANVHMAVHGFWPVDAPAWMGTPSPLALWLRLPVQGLLVLWAWWYTRA